MGALLLSSVAPRFLCRDFRLETGSWLIGRSIHCDLVVNHPSVSRGHAKITVAKTAAQVANLGSRHRAKNQLLHDCALHRS